MTAVRIPARPARLTRSSVASLCVMALALVAFGASPSSGATAGTAASGRIVFVSDRDGAADIYVMNADGTDQTRLTSDWAPESNPKWSPDGTRILFERYDDPDAHLYLMNADGTGVRRIFDVHRQGDASWSPEGARIVFNHWNPYGGLGIGIERSDGTHRHAVIDSSPNVYYVQRPDWSADGRWIAFDGTVEGIYQTIYRIRPDGSGLVHLTTGPAVDIFPRWAPDDRVIMFERDSSSGADLFVMNPDGTGQTDLTNGVGRSNTTPCWSPDGTMIAFSSDRDDPYPPDPMKHYQVYVMNADGSGVVQLTDQGNNFSPDWAPAAA